MVRIDVANHVIWTVQGVAQRVLVGCFMQTFNHTCKMKRHDHELQCFDGKAKIL